MVIEKYSPTKRENHSSAALKRNIDTITLIRMEFSTN